MNATKRIADCATGKGFGLELPLEFELGRMVQVEKFDVRKLYTRRWAPPFVVAGPAAAYSVGHPVVNCYSQITRVHSVSLNLSNLSNCC